MLKKIKAYKLATNLIWGIILLAGVIFFTAILLINNTFSSVLTEFLMAAITSLLAGVFAVAASLVNQYNTNKNQKFLEDIQTLGIDHLHFNKKDVLATLLQKNPRTIFISGYRLKLTVELSEDLYSAVKNGAVVNAIITPYWSNAYSLVYKEQDETIRTYVNFLSCLYDAVAVREETVEETLNVLQENFAIYLTNKPLFNDTYQIDDTFITSPYFHCLDERDRPVHAANFFTYEVSNHKTLWKMLASELAELKKPENSYQINWENFKEVQQHFQNDDLNLKEQCALFLNLLIQPLESNPEIDFREGFSNN